MKQVIVLAMHGAPPNDFPPGETAEFFRLHLQLEHAPASLPDSAVTRARELERRMREWPRTAANDPFWAASQEMAVALARAAGSEVVVAFNEFCGPSIEEAIGRAAATGTERIVVVTPMLTRGGEHAERDIPAAIGRARLQNPGVSVVYAWPFDPDEVAMFLASRLRRAAVPSGS